MEDTRLKWWWQLKWKSMYTPRNAANGEAETRRALPGNGSGLAPLGGRQGKGQEDWRG
jgi:hypothetical protein